jgi:hypothetical protein
MSASSHYFLHGNLVFTEGPEDVWAGYRLEGESYPGLSASRKIELKERLESFAYSVATDFQVMRVAREWSVDSYVERALAATLDRKRGHEARFRSMLEDHRALLSERRVIRPETYLFVRLGAPLQGAIGPERLAEIWRDLKRVSGLADARGISQRRIAELRRIEERTFDRLYDYVPCERARSHDAALLVRRAYTRGIGEPELDQNWRPQALWIEEASESEAPARRGLLGGLSRYFAKDKEGEDGPRFEPYEHDITRLHDSRVVVERRSLRVDSELGTSYQAHLVVGALPDDVEFPSRDAELMFAPLELDFPVDATFTAEFVPNPQAQKLAQKRMVDADQQAKEESYSDHGPSPVSEEKTYAARELQMRVGGSDRPPLLRSALVYSVAGETEEDLERRVDRLREELGRIELHRPVGEQHRLFLGAMPATRFAIPDYKAHLLPEEFGAMVPNAISHVGSEIGPYIGYTLSGSHAPVQFDAAEACAQSRPPTVLLTGSLGSGKTMAMGLLEYQAFLAGSFICDIDPKGGGDHGLLALPEVAERTEVIELGPEERYAGMLDPLRVGETETRAELAYAFLTTILPQPVPPEWQTEIRAAVEEVAAHEGGSTGEVVENLRQGTEAGKEAARALDVHLRGGLARLGYGHPDTKHPDVGEAQVVAIEIRNLHPNLPQPGTSRAEWQENERSAQAVLSLVASYALRLCAKDKRTHSILALDEAWTLLESQAGRTLLSRIARLGRSQNLTPILASQIIGDAEALEPLVGTYIAFGVETESEARRALELLGLDSDDPVMIQRLTTYTKGRAIMRDFDRLQAPIRIDPGPKLLAALDTTPEREQTLPRGGEEEVGEESADALAA